MALGGANNTSGFVPAGQPYTHSPANPVGGYASPSTYAHSMTSTSTNGSPPQAEFMEGPLPPEVREIIATSCKDLPSAEEAERQARRLLSTTRRVKVYRDELQAANAEVGDLEAVVQKHDFVCHALRQESSDIDAKVAQLLHEKQLCEAQLQQEGTQKARQQDKLAVARQRVAVLRRTVDNITQETQNGYFVLRQLVPNLHIDNYS